MNQKLSSLRSQLLQIQQLLPNLLQPCLERDPILPGSLYTLRRKCGKPSCHCNLGKLHESTVLSYRGNGRPKNISPADDQLEPLKKMTGHYRRCRKARTQFLRWHKQLLQLIDQLEAARCLLGEAEFQKLPKTSKPRSKRN